MTIQSHVAIGAMTWGAFAWRSPTTVVGSNETDPTAAALALILFAALGSFLPDLDHPGSAIARSSSRAVSWGISKILGHRGALHSLLAAVGLYLVASSTTGHGVSLALTWGYVAHLLADALTKQGVPLLWPVSASKIGLPLIASTTGGYGESIYVALIVAASALYAARVIL